MTFGLTIQFIMQTALIIVVALIFLPVISNLVFQSNLFVGTSTETQEHRDALWSWTIILFIASMAGNVVWYFRALQRQEAGSVEV